MTMITKKVASSLIVSGALFFLFLAIWILALWQTEKLNRIVSEEKGLLAQEEKSISDAFALQNVIRETENEREKINDLFVTEETIVDFLRRLETLSNNIGVALDLTSFQQEGDNRLSLHLEMTGDFESVSAFLKVVEELPYNLFVRSIDIHRGDGLVAISSRESRPLWTGTFILAIDSFLPDK